MINARLDAVEELLNKPALHQFCVATLHGAHSDAERAIGRVKRLSGNGKQLEPTMAAVRYAGRLKALGIAVTSVNKLWEALRKLQRGSGDNHVESYLLTQKVRILHFSPRCTGIASLLLFLDLVIDESHNTAWTSELLDLLPI